MKKLYLIGGLCLLLGGALVLARCTRAKAAPTEEGEVLKVPTQVLALQDTILQRDYVSAIKALRNVEIRSHLKSFLEEIYIDEGQLVRKGQTLFRLNDRELRAEMAKARAAMAIAEADAKTIAVEVERVQLLVGKKVVADSELALAQARWHAAQARVQEARAAIDHIAVRLEYTTIKAPFTGVIDRIPLKVGSLVEEGVLLTTLADISAMYGYFEVSENEYLTIAKATQSAENPQGTPVRLVLSDGTTYPHVGKIETMTGAFGESTGSIAFRAKFSNPERLLKHGATGKILITKPQDNVILIPQKAVLEIQDKNFVYVIDQQNIARVRSFTPKLRLAQWYVVADGLQPGERIAVEGVQYLRDGVLVKPI